MFSTLLETVAFVFDHLWTQDSPICPQTLDYKTGPYIDQGGSKLKVWKFQNRKKVSRLLAFERMEELYSPVKGTIPVLKNYTLALRP